MEPGHNMKNVMFYCWLDFANEAR